MEFKKGERVNVDIFGKVHEYEFVQMVCDDDSRCLVRQCDDCYYNVIQIKYVSKIENIKTFWRWDILTAADDLERPVEYMDEYLKEIDGYDSYENMNILWKRKVKGSEIKVNMDTMEIVD